MAAFSATMNLLKISVSWLIEPCMFTMAVACMTLLLKFKEKDVACILDWDSDLLNLESKETGLLELEMAPEELSF